MRRSATTLVEVLIAIFVMALGLISLLTLFPVGASQMAKAIQNERAAQIAASAASYFRMHWKGLCDDALAMNSNDGSLLRIKKTNSTITDPNVKFMDIDDSKPSNTKAMMMQWFPYALDDPNAGIKDRNLTINMTAAGVAPAALDNVALAETNAKRKYSEQTASYPVYLDPVGWLAGQGAATKEGLWMGSIPRRTFCGESWKQARTLPPIPVPANSPYQRFTELNKSQVSRSFFLLDDMTFSSNGTGTVTPSNIERQMQYSFAYLIRRKNNSDRTNVQLTVVVYLRRSIDTPSEEPAYDVTPELVTDPDGTQAFSDRIVFDGAGGRPSIKQGTWILDATVNSTSPQGFFYRVASISEPTSPGGDLEVILDRRLEAGPNGAKSRQFIVPDGVTEVFLKVPVNMQSSPSVK